MAGSGSTSRLSARLALNATIWATLAFSPCGFTDVDISEYQPTGSVRDNTQERALRQQFARERQREAERLRAEQEVLAHEREVAKALYAARPFPERLTRERCTKCHPAEHYARKRHTPLFWYLTVKRMVLLNEVELTPREQPVITNYLIETYPADPVRSAFELASLVALLGAVLAALIAVGRLTRKWKNAAPSRLS